MTDHNSTLQHNGFILLLPILACAGLLLVTISLADWRAKNLEEELREQLLIHVTDLAISLNNEPLHLLTFTAEDQHHPVFQRLHQHLHRYALFTGYRGIWTVIDEDNNYRFGPESYDDDDPMASIPGTQYQRPPPELRQLFHSARAMTTQPYQDEFGTFVSAFAPIHKTFGNKRIRMIVGIDIDYTKWLATINQVKHLPIIIGTSIVFLFVTTIIVQYWRRRYSPSSRYGWKVWHLETLLTIMIGLAVTIAATTVAMQLSQSRQNRLFERISEISAGGFSRVRALTAGIASARPPQDAYIMQQLAYEFGVHAMSESELFTLNLVRLDAAAVPRWLAIYPPNQNQTIEVSSHSVPFYQRRLQRVYPLFVGVHSYLLIVRATPVFLTTYPVTMSWMTTFIGLILTTVAAILVAWLRDRQLFLEKRVNERTTALWQREAKLSAITQAVRDAIISMDEQGCITYWNPAATELFGYSREEALGKDLHRLLAPLAAYQLYEQRYQQRLVNHHWQNLQVNRLVEVDAIRKDGSSRPMELSLSALPMGGHEWHAVGVLRDISARKQTESRLMRLNDCLASLGPDYQDNLQRITLVCGEIFQADSAMYNRLRGGRLVALGHWNVPSTLPLEDEPEGHICYDFICGHARLKNQTGAESVISQEQIILTDLRASPYQTLDPGVRDYGVSAYFGHLVHCEQRPVGSLCVLFKRPRQATEEEIRLLGILASALSAEERRYRATRQLEASQQRLSLAIRGTGIGVWDHNLIKDQLELDSQMLALLDLTGDINTPRQLSDLLQCIIIEDRTTVAKLMTAADPSQDEFQCEFRVQTNRALKILNVLGTVKRDDHQQPIRILGVCFDITPLKQVEIELRGAKEAAEHASQAKTHFLSQMTHELRTPMNAVLGFAQLLAYDEGLNEEQHEHVHEILTAGQNLLTLINDVLDLAHVGSDQAPLHLEPVALPEVVEEARLSLQSLIEQRQIHIEIGPIQNIVLQADRVRLRQIILNLLSNAIKYNHIGGSVIIGTQPATEDHLVRIGIHDTGPGIAEDVFEDLFEPFFRMTEVPTNDTSGYGIGLAVARRLTECMHGRIGVNSQIQQGATFWFELPAAIDRAFDNRSINDLN
jgi:PAS domain S-box-containing protein